MPDNHEIYRLWLRKEKSELETARELQRTYPERSVIEWVTFVKESATPARYFSSTSEDLVTHDAEMAAFCQTLKDNGVKYEIRHGGTSEPEYGVAAWADAVAYTPIGIVTFDIADDVKMPHWVRLIAQYDMDAVPVDCDAIWVSERYWGRYGVDVMAWVKGTDTRVAVVSVSELTSFQHIMGHYAFEWRQMADNSPLWSDADQLVEALKLFAPDAVVTKSDNGSQWDYGRVDYVDVEWAKPIGVSYWIEKVEWVK